MSITGYDPVERVCELQIRENVICESSGRFQDTLVVMRQLSDVQPMVLSHEPESQQTVSRFQLQYVTSPVMVLSQILRFYSPASTIQFVCCLRFQGDHQLRQLAHLYLQFLLNHYGRSTL